MPAFYYDGELAENESIYLSEEESLHCTRVLRLQKQDQIEVLNGRGQLFSGVIISDAKKKVGVALKTHVINKNNSRDYFLHIAIAPTKNTDRIEWFIEKSVEIGIDKISFFYSTYSERKKLRLDRLKKRAISAIKQSRNPLLPIISDVLSFEQVLKTATETQKFIAYARTETSSSLLKLIEPKGNYLVIIGPEGGFSEMEIDTALKNNFQLANLGNHILRTETAGISTCSMINAIHLE